MTLEKTKERPDDLAPAHSARALTCRSTPSMNKIVSFPIAEATPIVKLEFNHHPDAELVEIVEQFIVAERKYRELLAAVDRIEEGFKICRPLPKVLRWRKSDLKLGLPALHKCPAMPKPNWDAPVQVDVLRRKKGFVHSREAVKGHPIKGMFQDRISVFTPSKAARERANEILAAYDEWAKEGVPPRGYKKSVSECNKADTAAFSLEKRILERRARTVDGMFAKIRVAHTRGVDRLNKVPPLEKL